MLVAALFLLARWLAGWLLTLRIRNRNARLRAADAAGGRRRRLRCLAKESECVS